MTTRNEPIACTLPASEAEAGALAWADLRKKALSTERLDHGLAMTFGRDLAATVEEMAAREAVCCSFLSIKTSHTDDAVRIEITSDDPNALPIIQGFQGLITEVDIA